MENNQVTPFVGVWIETQSSPAMQRRLEVTPFVGVWIETCAKTAQNNTVYVTPFVGVWIETSKAGCRAASFRVTPFVGVWIETIMKVRIANNKKSHPSWVCGLKLILGSLKDSTMCHTLRGCVD